MGAVVEEEQHVEQQFHQMAKEQLDLVGLVEEEMEIEVEVEEQSVTKR